MTQLTGKPSIPYAEEFISHLPLLFAWVAVPSVLIGIICYYICHGFNIGFSGTESYFKEETK